MLYKAMAAFAAGLIETNMAPMIAQGAPCFGLDKTGTPTLSFFRVHTYSILGAMRYAHTCFGLDGRAYNALDRAVRREAAALGKTLDQLDRLAARCVLFDVARGKVRGGA